MRQSPSEHSRLTIDTHIVKNKIQKYNSWQRSGGNEKYFVVESEQGVEHVSWEGAFKWACSVIKPIWSVILFDVIDLTE